MVDLVSKRYLDSEYLDHNPDWDMIDSPWKAKKVSGILRSHGIVPETICEVGCGAGRVLDALQREFIDTQLTGYDIAPGAEQFWEELRERNIQLYVGDFISLNKKNYDVVLLLDVLEHVADPLQFLHNISSKASYLVIHFPLDLSALSVFREKPLLHVRRKVGHIHYFTKGLALELLDECGLEVIAYQYTDASNTIPQRSLKTKLFSLVRRVVCLFNKDIGVRLLGGETLMVLAKPV